ncbi:MAG: Ig-like domain-containing protein [Oscillospiraceae bacterium]|nr:Ig-like domain-containing protein [Oscillospiraceae bacterium]
MSKVICDICGTTYPDTAEQCPICGCVRPGDVQSTNRGTGNNSASASRYTYVKGGRFSKSNVKKRNKAQVTANGIKPVVSGNVTRGDTSTSTQSKPKNSAVLVIIAIILTLAIIAVILNFTLRFFLPIMGPDVTDPTDSTSGTQPSTQEQDLSCTKITLDTNLIVFDTLNAARVLNVVTEPLNTTDVITFESSDDSVATVNSDGKITSVGNGSAVITVTCGDIAATCNISCKIPEETTEPTQDVTEEPTVEPTEESTIPYEPLHLNRKDITFSYEGETWMLYDGTIAKNLITWSSDNEAVVTIAEGRAVAVGPGTTYVYAEYNGEKVSCIIRCSFSSSSGDSGVPGNGGGIGEDG